MSENESVVSFGVSLYPDDAAMLQQIGKDYGLNSRSATIRFLIRDWARLQQQLAALNQFNVTMMRLPGSDDGDPLEELVPA